jgi:site-specific recombinase XerD
MDFEAYKRRDRQNVSEGTVNSRVSALKRFEKEANVSGEPTVQDVEKWIDRLIELCEDDQIKSGTVRQYYKAVRYYFRRMKGGAEQIDHISDWIPSGDTDHGDFLLREELNEVRLKAYSQRARVIIEMMYRYARRPGEIIRLNMDDVSFTSFDDGNMCPECRSESNDELGTLHSVENEYKRLVCDECEHEEADEITFPILKKDDTFRATFYLLNTVKAPLVNYVETYRGEQKVEGKEEWEEETVRPIFTTSHGRVSYDTVYKNIKQIAERAGIDKNITPKSLRHSRATHLDWEGESPEVIARQQLLHDPDTQTIGSYVHDRDEDQTRDVMTAGDQ